MNKLFKFTQAKGKWHKFPSFNLGGGAKLYKNFAQKLLAVSLCMAVVLLGTPVTTFAEDPPSPQFEIDTSTGYIKSVSGAGNLTTITIPRTDGNNNAIKGVNPGVFDDCTSLERFAVDDAHEYLSVGSSGELLGRAATSGDYNILYRLPPAFATKDTDGVVTYTLPAAVTEIKAGAFTNCSRLEQFDLGSDYAGLSWGDFSFSGCSGLASFSGWRGSLGLSGAGASLLAVSPLGYSHVRVAPAASLPLALPPDLAEYACSASAFVGCSRLPGLLFASGDYLSWSRLSLASMFGAPVLVPSTLVASLPVASDSDPASVLGYEEGAEDFDTGRTELLITSRSGNTTKPLPLACDTFDDYTLAIKDGVQIANLTIGHGDPTDDNHCSLCGADLSVPVAGVSLSETTKTLTVGESFDLTATISPENATDKTVTWTSSNDAVATVSGDGLTGTVTALKAGSTTITVTTDDGGKTAECVVSVQAVNDGVAVPPGSAEGDVDDDPADGDELPPVDRSSWGTPYVRADGVTQYVVEDPTSPDYGMTSVPLATASSAGFGGVGPVAWVHESSGGTSAWYGLLRSSVDALAERGSGPVADLCFYVQWLKPGDVGYDAVFANLDDSAKAATEGRNGELFNIGIRDANGNEIRYPKDGEGNPLHPVVFVQIGDDWDEDDLRARFVSGGADEQITVESVNMLSPDNQMLRFGRMTLDHFSPYYIFDELTAEELAVLKKDTLQTGDLATQLLISGLAIVLVSSLGVMLRLITNRKKFEE